MQDWKLDGGTDRKPVGDQLLKIIIRPAPINGYMELRQSWEKAGKRT